MNVAHSLRSQKGDMTALAINKSLLKEFVTSKSSRTVFMNGGQEFQIQLFNPYTYRIGAKISINGEWMSDTLIIRPGERIWLDRYLSTPNKFKFDTYEVDDDSCEVRDAIRKNGVIRVSFYKEKEETPSLHVYKSNVNPYWLNPTPTTISPSVYYCNSTCGKATVKGIDAVANCPNSAVNGDQLLGISSISSLSISGADSAATSVNYCNSADPIETSKIETGRVEKGGHSNQKFDYVDADFEYCSFKTDEICILPLSTKPVSSNDLNKKYCTQCGKKLSPKFKFCPSCGAKV